MAVTKLPGEYKENNTDQEHDSNNKRGIRTDKAWIFLENGPCGCYPYDHFQVISHHSQTPGRHCVVKTTVYLIFGKLDETQNEKCSSSISAYQTLIPHPEHYQYEIHVATLYFRITCTDTMGFHLSIKLFTRVTSSSCFLTCTRKI